MQPHNYWGLLTFNGRVFCFSFASPAQGDEVERLILFHNLHLFFIIGFNLIHTIISRILSLFIAFYTLSSLWYVNLGPYKYSSRQLIP